MKVGDTVEIYFPPEFEYLKPEILSAFIKFIGKKVKIVGINDDAINIDIGKGWNGHDCGGLVKSNQGRDFYTLKSKAEKENNIRYFQDVSMLRNINRQIEFDFGE